MASLQCTICQEDLTEHDNTEATPCGHVYHQSCLTSWSLAAATCPICRTYMNQNNNCESSEPANTTKWTYSTKANFYKGALVEGYEFCGRVEGFTDGNWVWRTAPNLTDHDRKWSDMMSGQSGIIPSNMLVLPEEAGGGVGLFYLEKTGKNELKFWFYAPNIPFNESRNIAFNVELCIYFDTPTTEKVHMTSNVGQFKVHNFCSDSNYVDIPISKKWNQTQLPTIHLNLK